MSPPEDGEAPRGQLIGPRSQKGSAGSASLTFLRTLTLGRVPAERARPTAQQVLDGSTAEDPAAVSAVRQALSGGDGLAALDTHLAAERVAQLPRALRVQAFAHRARVLHERGSVGPAAEDWLAVFSLEPAKLPEPVVPWVALNRIRALDASALAIQFYKARAKEIDRVIKERPPLDRDALLRSLVTICGQDWDAADEAVVELVSGLVKLNRRHAGFQLMLGVRLVHAGRLADAGGALDRAEAAARTAGFEDRRESLRLLHLYRGAVQFAKRDVAAARRSFRRAMALEPLRLEAALMYAELEACLGERHHGLNRARALRLVGKVETAIGGGEASLRPWLKAVVGERCATLRRELRTA